MSDRFMML